MGNVLLKTFLGLASLMLVLALVLFVSAGSIRFWQAWGYLTVFSICTILITIYLIRCDPALLARRVKVGPAAETQKNQQLIQSVANLLFLVLLIVPGLDYRFHWSEVPPAVSLLSNILIAGGFFIMFLAFRVNSYTSGTIEVSQGQEVITSGLYSVVRHPMYAGAILLLIFTPLALGSWVGLPISVSLILAVALRSHEEEKFLSANLRGYAEYCQKMRYRFIPFVW